MEVFPAPLGAEDHDNLPGALRARWCARHVALLDILQLLTDFFQFLLHPHHQVGNLLRAGLGSDRVHFAVHLLNQKIQPAARRFIAAQGFQKELVCGCENGRILP